MEAVGKIHDFVREGESGSRVAHGNLDVISTRTSYDGLNGFLPLFAAFSDSSELSPGSQGDDFFWEPSMGHSCCCSGGSRCTLCQDFVDVDIAPPWPRRNINNNNTTIWRGSVLTGEEPPRHSWELNHALSPSRWPNPIPAFRPMSSRHHISMEHRLRRKHLMLNPNTKARYGTYSEKCGDSRVWYEYFLVVTRDVLSYALVSPECFLVESTRVLFWSAQYELCKFV